MTRGLEMTITKRLIGIVMAVLLFVSYLPAYSFADDNIASGRSGTCDWVIDANGTLTISSGEMGMWTDKDDAPWHFYATYIKSVVTLGPVKLKTCCGLFSDCDGLKSLDVVSFDTTDVTDMRSMFRSCISFTNLDLSSFDTSSVTDMSDMFSGCHSLTSLDLSKFDTSCVTDMSYMFSGCHSFTNLDLSSFDTSSVTDMSYMFSGCNSLTSPDLSGFDTSSVTDMSYMFSGCDSFTSLDLSSFDTSSVTDMRSMFYSCTSLRSLDLSSFDTTDVTNMGNMFENCTSLRSLDLSSFDISNAWTTGKMFYSCTELQSLELGKWSYGTSNYRAKFPVVMKDTFTGIVYESGADIPECDFHTFVAVDVDSNHFTLGRDNNSFYHFSSESAISGFYEVNDRVMGIEYLNALRKESDLGSFSKTIIDQYMPHTGWCFGIASTMALVHEGKISVADITNDTAKTYFEMSPPYVNDKLLHTINYYHVSQSRISSQVGYYITIPSAMINGDALYLSDAALDYQQFLKRFVSAAKNETLVLGLPDHAVLVTGCEQVGEEQYTLEVYDENSVSPDDEDGEFGHIDINTAEFDMTYTDYKGDVVLSSEQSENAVLCYMSATAIANASEEGIKVAKEKSIITVPRRKPVTVYDINGKTILKISAKQVLSTVPIYKVVHLVNSTRGDEGSSNDYMQLEIDKVDGITVNSECNEPIAVSLSDSDNAATVSGVLDKAVIDFDKGVTVTGDVKDYYVGISSQKIVNNQKQVLMMSGDRATDLKIISNNGQYPFEVSCTGENTNAKATMYNGSNFVDIASIGKSEHTYIDESGKLKPVSNNASVTNNTVGNTYTVNGSKYKVLSESTVALIKSTNKKSVKVPNTVKIRGKTFKVVQINAKAFKGKKIHIVTIGKNIKKIKRNAFKGSKATKLIVKSKRLTKKSIVGSLKGSKIKTVKVKVGKKSDNKKYVKKYKKVFTKKNAGKKVTVQ